MSMANTRLRRCAHDIARCRSLTDTLTTCCGLAAVRVPGTIRARSRLAGANTPWYLVSCVGSMGACNVKGLLLALLNRRRRLALSVFAIRITIL